MEEAIHVRSHEQPVPSQTAALEKILSQTVLKSFIYIAIPQKVITVI